MKTKDVFPRGNSHVPQITFLNNLKSYKPTTQPKNALVATSLLTSCNNLLQQADIRMRSHGLRQLLTTSM